jgi:hypothetical protein
MKSRSIFVFGIIVVLAVVAVIAIRGFTPKSEITGTIGAADRYQSEQVTAEDVTLDDPEIQAFLQTDLYHEITQNEDFQKMLQAGDFQKLLADANYRQLIQVAEYQKVKDTSEYKSSIRLQPFSRVLSAADFGKVWTDVRIKALFTNADEMRVFSLTALPAIVGSDPILKTFVADNQPIMTDPNFRQLMDSAVQRKLSRAANVREFARQNYLMLTNNPDFKRLTAGEGFAEICQIPEIMSGLANGRLQRILFSPQLTDILSSASSKQHFLMLCSNPDFQKLCADANFRQLMVSPDFQRLLTMTQFSAVLGNPPYQKLLSRPAMMSLENNAKYRDTVRLAAFNRLSMLTPSEFQRTLTAGTPVVTGK